MIVLWMSVLVRYLLFPPQYSKLKLSEPQSLHPQNSYEKHYILESCYRIKWEIIGNMESKVGLGNFNIYLFFKKRETEKKNKRALVQKQHLAFLDEQIRIFAHLPQAKSQVMERHWREPRQLSSVPRCSLLISMIFFFPWKSLGEHDDAVDNL